MTSSPRVEPPEELRDRDGWHWLGCADGEPLIHRWTRGYWEYRSWPSISPDKAAANGYRYIAACLTPAEVAAERDAAVARAEALAAATEAPLSVLDTVGVIIGQAIVCRTLTFSEVEIDRILHVRDELRAALAAYRAASPKSKP